MRLRSALTALAAAGLLASTAMSTAVLAQDEEPVGVKYFTGTLEPSFPTSEEGAERSEAEDTYVEGYLPGVFCQPGGAEVVTAAGETGSAALAATDPRISGDVEFVDSSLVCAHPEGWPHAIVGSRTVRITNEHGSWSGSGFGYGVYDYDIADGLISEEDHVGSGSTMWDLTGAGDYEGLTAIVHTVWEYRPELEFEWEQVARGVIVPGEIPPASDFDGSEEARTWLTPLPEGHGDDDDGDGGEVTGLAVPMDEAAWAAIEALGDLGTPSQGGAEFGGPLSDFLDFLAGFPEECPDCPAEELARAEQELANYEAALTEMGLDASEVPGYYGWIATEQEGLLSMNVGHFVGADPELIRDFLHPDGERFVNPWHPRNPGTMAEEVQYGDKTVYRTWYEDRANRYWYFEDDAVLEISGPDGPESAPDEAAVEAFFLALGELVE